MFEPPQHRQGRIARAVIHHDDLEVVDEALHRRDARSLRSSQHRCNTEKTRRSTAPADSVATPAAVPNTPRPSNHSYPFDASPCLRTRAEHTPDLRSAANSSSSLDWHGGRWCGGRGAPSNALSMPPWFHVPTVSKNPHLAPPVRYALSVADPDQSTRDLCALSGNVCPMHKAIVAACAFAAVVGLTSCGGDAAASARNCVDIKSTIDAAPTFPDPTHGSRDLGKIRRMYDRWSGPPELPVHAPALAQTIPADPRNTA
jgi:hypothetical protein